MSKPIYVVVLLSTTALAAQATVRVSATSSSFAQASPNGNQSYADVLNGAQLFPNFAGPGGTSNSGPIGPGATSAFANTTQPDNGLLATSSAQADLATGTLRSSAEAPGAPGGGASLVIANARWIETVSFNNTSGGTVELGVSWTTEGVVTTTSPVGFYSIGILSGIGLSNGNAPLASPISLKDDNPATLNMGGQYYNYATAGGAAAPFFTGNNAENAWTITLSSPTSSVLSATLLIPNGRSVMEIDALMNLDCRSGVLCDFAHTASFGFSALPVGLTWTSESGVFLSAAVPEPTTWLLFGAGLGAVALARRRRTVPRA